MITTPGALRQQVVTGRVINQLELSNFTIKMSCDPAPVSFQSHMAQ